MNPLYPPSYDGILDIRSAGFLNDKVHEHDKCAPGAAKAAIKGPFFRTPNRNFIETSYDWVLAITAAVLVIIIYGIHNSYPIFVPYIQAKYKQPYFDIAAIGAAANGLFVMLLPVALFIELVAGKPLTVVFGAWLCFFALFIEYFGIHYALLVITRLIFLPFGTALIYNAAMNAVAEHFNKHLTPVLILLSSSPMIGTFVFARISTFLCNAKAIGYSWTLLIYAMILLFVIPAAFSLPRSKTINILDNEDTRRSKQIEMCLRNAALEKARRSRNEFITNNPNTSQAVVQAQGEEELIPFLCVCSFKMKYHTTGFNCSLFLWPILSALAVMTFNIPYWYIIDYCTHNSISPMSLIFWFCFGTIAGRIFIISNIDHRFIYNRIVFQLALCCSGGLFFGFKWTDTHGWILLWITAMSIFIGILSAVIPRVTLQTIPRPLLRFAWILAVEFQGIALILIPIAVAFLSHYRIAKTWADVKDDYVKPFLIVGIIQFITAILTFMISNEEDSVKNLQSSAAAAKSGKIYSGQQRGRRSSKLFIVSEENKRLRSQETESIPRIPFTKFSSNYTENCSICAEIGCIPECNAGCVPGGLVNKSTTKQNEAPVHCV